LDILKLGTFLTTTGAFSWSSAPIYSSGVGDLVAASDRKSLFKHSRFQNTPMLSNSQNGAPDTCIKTNMTNIKNTLTSKFYMPATTA